VVFSWNLFLEGRNEARGRAPEASADQFDFHQEKTLPGLAPPSQEGTSTSSPRTLRGAAAFSLYEIVNFEYLKLPLEKSQEK
jgi:hypothetical protein